MMKDRLCVNYCILFSCILGFLFVTSCTEKKTEEFTELTEDIAYTDTFTPFDWENPFARQILRSGDSEIGMFIGKDVTDPGKRKTRRLIEQFIERLSKGQLPEIKELLTDPAYNSFMLRYPKISFSSKYSIRVEDKQAAIQIPGSAPAPQVNPQTDESENWIRFKIIFSDKSLIGTVEVVETEGTYKIGDFENDIFDELTAQAPL